MTFADCCIALSIIWDWAGRLVTVFVFGFALRGIWMIWQPQHKWESEWYREY